MSPVEPIREIFDFGLFRIVDNLDIKPYSCYFRKWFY